MSEYVLDLIFRMNGAASEEGIAIVRAIARTREPGAIDALALMLDIAGPIGEAAVDELRCLGEAAEPAMRACIASDDADRIRNGRRVLRTIQRRRAAAKRAAGLGGPRRAEAA
jgi:hypothetical protein